MYFHRLQVLFSSNGYKSTPASSLLSVKLPLQLLRGIKSTPAPSLHSDLNPPEAFNPLQLPLLVQSSLYMDCIPSNLLFSLVQAGVAFYSTSASSWISILSSFSLVFQCTYRVLDATRPPPSTWGSSGVSSPGCRGHPTTPHMGGGAGAPREFFSRFQLTFTSKTW